MHKEAVVRALYGETHRTLVVSGRPLRMLPNDYIKDWEKRPQEIADLTAKGIVPMMHDLENEKEVDMPFLMGDVSASITEIKPAGDIVREMVKVASEMLKKGASYTIGSSSKL
ncbi:hypothetical protein KXX11_002535 [Aspergillus fumigatus]|nr:hypothetical protein KXX11_002535 [Aspergillus fumigatus]